MKPLLGTYVEISIEYSDETTPINDWFSQAFARIDALQQKLSIHSATSELNQINLNPNVWIPISRESRRLLQLAMILMHKSDGLFNPTLGANLLGHGIVDDLGFGKRAPFGSVHALSFSGDKVKLNEYVIVCLDGIAKGYALDLALKSLKRLGCENASINAGGDIKAIGTRRVPIQPKFASHPIGFLQNAAIATSGTYHSESHRSRLMDEKGVIMPAGNEQWSVLAFSAWRADALTKVAAQTQGDEHLLATLGGRLLSSA
ncbi:FAD:protein FMN transferase [Pseudoalteromonas xiamenensis]|uniref:FAD:protein FMN transferase n=1 Tax=Pseudoalteromonas xiamenensis TaxID=882626 RepID=UPI0035E51DF2